VATDVEEAPPRPAYTPVERDTHKRMAVGPRKIDVIRERIREVQKVNNMPTSVRLGTPTKFHSIRSSYIKGEGSYGGMNELRCDSSPDTRKGV
jgi:hypothetical protein